MRISELVAKLEAIKAEWGDLFVYHENDWGYFEVEKVVYEPADDSYPEDHVWHVGRESEHWKPERVELTDKGNWGAPKEVQDV